MNDSKKTAKAALKTADTGRQRSKKFVWAKQTVKVSIALALILCVGLGVLAALMPGMRINRVHKYINAGRTREALESISELALEEYPADKLDELRTELAQRYLLDGDFKHAQTLIRELPDSESKNEMSRHAQYIEALNLYDEDDFDAAARIFYSLDTYADSASRYTDCLCALAVLKYISGDENGARHTLYGIADAPAHISGAVDAACTLPQQAEALKKLDLFNPQALARIISEMEQINEQRAESGVTRISAGYRHTVAVCSDGRVLAAGDNTYGQCDVSDWEDVTQVCAGAYHTAALKKDGTVSAVGANESGQCDVSDWTDITELCAGAYATFGLKADGTVVATGDYAQKVSAWRGVTRISAGSYSAGCLYGQGSMMATHEGAQMNMTVTLTTLTVCGAVSAGFDMNGKLVCSNGTCPDWTSADMSYVALTQTGYIGVTADGKIVQHLFRTGTDEYLTADAFAVEAASSGTHTVVLTEDGRVHAYGLNDCGQCNVGNWQL